MKNHLLFRLSIWVRLLKQDKLLCVSLGDHVESDFIGQISERPGCSLDIDPLPQGLKPYLQPGPGCLTARLAAGAKSVPVLGV
jgi:hypothetical protein